MFDKLVESTKQKPQGRNKFYLLTSLIYGTALSAVAVLTIIWFNPGMAEANTVIGMLAPPPVPVSAPPPDPKPSAPAPPDQFISPIKPPATIADPTKVLPKPPAVNRSVGIVGAPVNSLSNADTGIPTSAIGEPTEAPPPPPPAPTPKVTPTPTPTPKVPDIVRMTSEMVTGKAVRKVQPPYPQIAKAVRAQGTVPVQIVISEEGRVMQATVVGGNPTLHEAARQAALQWVFSPTVLNGKPVKVSGVISFNFILN